MDAFIYKNCVIRLLGLVDKSVIWNTKLAQFCCIPGVAIVGVNQIMKLTFLFKAYHKTFNPVETSNSVNTNAHKWPLS